MLKKLGMFLLVSLLALSGFISTGFTSFAESTTQMIRIGVVPSAESISIGSNEDFTITDKETGEVIYTGENGEVNVELSSSATIETNFRLQTAWTTSVPYMQDWLNRAEAAGYETYVEDYLDGWRLLIGKFPTDAGWSERESFRQQMIAEGFAASDSYWRVITVSSGESEIKVVADGFEQIVPNAIQISSENGVIKINGSQYRGIGEVGFNSAGTLAGINELPLEEYLYGVVPRELPPVPYGELEAQKSQAVAARTYAISGLGKRSADGYDLLPTTSDQVYGGYDVEHPISTQAVQETEGVVATYNGKLINAVYHSTTGGYTANNEDVWASDPVPYLRGVPDSQRGKAIENVPTLEVFKSHANPKSLRAQRNGDFEADWSKYHRWYFQWTNEEISEVLSDYFSTDVGEVYEINVLERSNSGRVLEIEFVTENGTFYEFKDRIRWSLKYINANGGQSVLLSTLFYVEPVIDNSTKTLTGFEVYGGGWGHGVGLSQTGAMGMAVKGHTYDEILKHYYQGIELEERY
ncbi:SpoIID/LytB domain-containing protein [Ornithinibacillus californiensis]|uniref:SpoIID/LytB domain-containing protein n=1 Tax=Ornithinibacillus californiensis TaxID=161536 RepID=UPI00064DDBAD|nr:SpoIID/LytB domain-containing protein [Ornithinibacillus californiensis]